MKNILIADNAGFCFGVKRAMNMAWNELDKSDKVAIYALGPLIHNKQAVAKYEERGMLTVDTIEEIEKIESEKVRRGINASKDREMIIRSHGVSKSIYDEAKLKNIPIIDTTCPFVRKIHYLANKCFEDGKQLIVIGDRNHPEIIGINGWSSHSAIIAKNLEEISNISFETNKDYFIVAQTTMNEKEFDAIINYIRSLDIKFEVENTICSATRVRQESARELAQKVDLMIVIGGKHSSNTQKLVKICQDIVDTFSIETKEDLDRNLLEKYHTIGITAGASTPDWIIEEVINFLREL
ncbi:4-hydroxy-3-methylbut-2-enyl diphosphate reductase [Peptostreptococcus stomatis]|uniref:4-hydroxy-3-methylbut-2-enyl diphosphate reductase n=1 Tax=Peptostreptococcus stomatis DSM 17678 TaxID=596315 RepID=E0E2Y6_9FIRM|nr:4-hydroxy-3-methylbut-2-enyl diphosphate reductase [Peptostreptococcus stomatis]EFM64759.1 4-hydroxy-3-methylbut-2-enyl diphosphate reductase [Peptostreptococcus stomatis DSM 17678]